ncbi:all-trans-retinol dehydrogenase (NAD+) [Friedmanniella endophytica]|uniref:All-trans-retinol dehydrogenase (NAD+) n=1 Tax=Microlunatus kandeliicorticis TaxID=1759536 RepID=A0A7W3P5F3_9ACTN|nr:SDR family oxidoreductase [Microlunatus kandeliicorticis]MBA8793921.1 all-trans-retinol dehydrogenase (NAD+) [Microlunatus kandeliicorticis]
MRNRLRGQRVLVTGASNGIGRLMALEAARRGASVVLWGLDATALDRVRDEARALGVGAEARSVDVSDRAAVGAAAAGTAAVDVVINNAGVVSGKRLLDADDEAIERTFAVNTLAHYWVVRAFLPAMISRDRGTVVTVASAGGLVGVARQTDYAASKFAAVGFTESLRVELKRDRSRVRTLLVCPYYIDTGMFDGVRTRFPALLPILRPDDVVTKIMDALENGREKLYLPWIVHALAPLRLLPVPLFDAVVNLFGINRTMDHFTGRRR